MTACRWCRFWHYRGVHDDNRANASDFMSYPCRRRSPDLRGYENAAWPQTYAQDWCGEFEWCATPIEAEKTP